MIEQDLESARDDLFLQATVREVSERVFEVLDNNGSVVYTVNSRAYAEALARFVSA